MKILNIDNLDKSESFILFRDKDEIISYLAIHPNFSYEFDQLGIESGKVQQLNGPITSISKLLESNNITIIYHKDHQPLGYIKFGYKDLFFYQKDGKIIECKNKSCLLDFYVNEKIQRNGIGLLLFQMLLSVLSVDSAITIAYDRPSSKLISFLAKHYHLTNGDLQPNRFMIFNNNNNNNNNIDL